MASKRTHGPVPSKTTSPPPIAAPAPKKTRKNPARRKAERANTANAQGSKDATAFANGNLTPPPAAAAAAAAALPTKPSRQASAPSVLGDRNAAKAPAQNKKKTNAAPASKAGVAPASASAPASTTQPESSTATQQQPNPSTSLAQTPHPTRPKPNRNTPTNNIPTSAHNTPALLTGGLIGCASSLLLLPCIQIWHDFSGPQAAMATARSARFCIDNVSEELLCSLRAGTYSGAEALDVLRRTTLAYASGVPGGAGVVERVFREVEAVRTERGEEVDCALEQAYAELREVGRRGGDAGETREVVSRHLAGLSLVAGRAARGVLSRNPRLESWRDGAVGALREPDRGRVPTTRVNLVVKHKHSSKQGVGA